MIVNCRGYYRDFRSRLYVAKAVGVCGGEVFCVRSFSDSTHFSSNKPPPPYPTTPPVPACVSPPPGSLPPGGGGPYFLEPWFYGALGVSCADFYPPPVSTPTPNFFVTRGEGGGWTRGGGGRCLSHSHTVGTGWVCVADMVFVSVLSIVCLLYGIRYSSMHVVPPNFSCQEIGSPTTFSSHRSLCGFIFTF